MKFYKQIVLVLFALVAFSNCSKKTEEGPDTTLPGVTVDVPLVNQKFPIGGELKLTATFTDNKDLKECIVSLSYVGDAPRSSELKRSTGIEDPWTPDPTTIPLTGKTQTVTGKTLWEASIPESKTGIYKLRLEVRDNAEIPNIKVHELNIELI